MRSARLVVIVSCVIAALLSGCGSDAKNAASKLPTPEPVDTTGDPAFHKALDALTAAKSFHAKAAGGQGGQTTFDIHFGTAGSKTSITGAGVALEFVSDGTNVYLKAPSSVWTSSLPATVPNAEAAVGILASKWVKVDTSQAAFKQYATFTSKAQYVEELRKTPGHFALGGKDTVNGQPTLVLNGSDGTKWWVQDGGAGRPLKTSSGTSSAELNGSVLIDGWDEPFSPQLPVASDVVDYKAVTG